MTVGLPVPKVPIPTEKETERAVKDLYRKLGLKVWSLSQGYRPGAQGGGHATTRQTKGIADLFVTGRGKVAWHEVKRPGRIRPAQLKKQEDQRFFEEAVVACGMPYAFGGVGAAMLALRDVWGIGVQPIIQEPDRLTLPHEGD